MPLKMFCQLRQALAKVGCFNNVNETLGDCSGSKLSLSYTTCFGSCLIALPDYSSNIISLLRPSMGLKIRQSQLPSSYDLDKPIFVARLRLFRIEYLLQHLSCAPCLILFMLVVILYLISVPIEYSFVLGLDYSCLDKRGR